MEGTRLGNVMCRILLLLFAAVVLGISVTMAREWDEFDGSDGCRAIQKAKTCREVAGRWPVSTDYSAFVGGFGLVDAAIGLVAAFLTAVPRIAVLVVDALAAIFYLAGGVNLAVLYNHQEAGEELFDSTGQTRYQADIAFMFLGLITALIAMGLHFTSARSGRYSAGGV